MPQLILSFILLAAAQTFPGPGTSQVTSSPTGACTVGNPNQLNSISGDWCVCKAGTWTCTPAGSGSGGLPAGAIILISSGTCPSGYAEATELNGVMLRGTLAANADVGTAGGADTITPTGTNTAPGFTGTLATLAHAGTAVSAHAGTAVANHVFTQPTIAWPVGVPTNANESSHTHGGPTVSWPAGVPTQAAHTHDSHTTAATGSSGASRLSGPTTHSSLAPAISWPAGVPTNGATGAGAAHTHTVSWPAGVPANSGGAVDAHAVTQPAAHTVTQPSDHSYTPAGAVAAPVFTGNSFSNIPAHIKVIFCKKT